MKGMKRGKAARAHRSSDRKASRTPFQIELIRLIEAHAGALEETSGRALSARLGKSSNHLWQILNRGMIPSGPAILDIARVLGLGETESERLILKAIETKRDTRSRDSFWIGQVREMVVRRDAEIEAATAFLEHRGLREAFLDWRGSNHPARRGGVSRAGEP